MNDNRNDKKDDQDIVLVNVLESTVREETAKLMRTMNMCHCEKCYLDACAIALNALEPKYVTSEKGGLLSTIATIGIKYQMELTIAISKALLTVKEYPRH